MLFKKAVYNGLNLDRSSYPKVFCEKVFLKFSQNLQENTCPRVSFLMKLQASACNFIKKDTLAQVLPYKFCEVFKNTASYRTTPVTASI